MENQWRLYGFTQTEGVKIQQMFQKFFLSLKVSTFFENGDRAFSESIHQRRVSYLQLT